MSGVVSPVETLSSGVVTPSVPIEAARSPAMRQICRVISTVEVLPLVPVTATTVSGTGGRTARRARAKARRGSGVGDMGRAVRPWPRAGRRRRSRRRSTAAGMKSSPLNSAPLKAPNTVPGATLRWSIAKPVTWASDAARRIEPRRGGERAELHSVPPAVADQRREVREVDVAAVVGHDSEHRSDPRDHPPDDRRRVPRGGALVRGGGVRLGIVEHGDDHVARLVHREGRGESRHQRVMVIAAGIGLFGTAGLAADTVARRVGLAPRAVDHDHSQQLADARAGARLEHAATHGPRRPVGL